MNDLSDYEDEGGGKKKKDKKESKKDKVSYATLAGDESDEDVDTKTTAGGIAKKLKTPFKLPSAKKKDKEKDKDKDKNQPSDKKSSSSACSVSTSGVSVIEVKDKEKKLTDKEKKLLDKERKLSDKDKEKKEKERKSLEKEKKSKEEKTIEKERKSQEKDKKIFERKLSLEKDKDRKVVLPNASTSTTIGGGPSVSAEKVRRPFSSSYIPSASFDHHDSPFSPSRIAADKDKPGGSGALNLSFNAFINAPAPVFSRKHKESHKDKDKDKEKHSKDKEGTTKDKDKKAEKDHTSKVKLKLIRSTKSSFDDSRIDSPSQHLFPEDAESIAKEIKKYEALLEQTHTSIKSSKKVSKKNEEMLWELQRTLTQLKRKLRSVNILNSTVPPSQQHQQQQETAVSNSSNKPSSQIKAEESSTETQTNQAATTSNNVVDKSTSPLQQVDSESISIVKSISKNEDLKTISPPHDQDDHHPSESPSESIVDDEITLDFTLQKNVSNPKAKNDIITCRKSSQGDQKLKKSNTTGSVQSHKSIDNATATNSNLNDNNDTVIEKEIERVQVEVEVHNFSFDSDDEIQVLDKESEENEMLCYSGGPDADPDMISPDGETEKEIAELSTKAQYDLQRANLLGQNHHMKNESFDLNQSIDQSSKSEPIELCPPPPLEQLQHQHVSALLEKDDTLETDESFDIDIESENIRIAKKLDFDGCYDDFLDRDDVLENIDQDGDDNIIIQDDDDALLSSEYENDEEYSNTVLYPIHKQGGFLTSDADPDDIDPFEIPIFDTDDYLKVENQALREYNEGLLERIADEENEIENMMEQLMDMKNNGIDIDVPEFEYDLDDYDGNELLALWQTSKIENESLNDHVYHLRKMVAGSKLEEFKLQVRLRFLEENDQQIITKNEPNETEEPTLLQLDDEHL